MAVTRAPVSITRSKFWSCCERLQIARDDLGPGRVAVGIRPPPALAFEQRCGCRIDAVAPRREDADVAPIPQVCADRRAGFIELYRQVARDQVRRGCQADRPAADHGDGQGFEGCRAHIPSFRHHRNCRQKREVQAAASPCSAVHSAIDAALVDQKADQAVHRGIVGAAKERRRLTLLRDQTREDQPMKMVGKRRSRDPELFLQAAHRQPFVTCPDEGAIHLEPRRDYRGLRAALLLVRRSWK